MAGHTPRESKFAKETGSAIQGFVPSSALALCVSPEMKNQLGPHPNAQVLYPIPEPGGSRAQLVELNEAASRPEKEERKLNMNILL